MQPRTTTLYRAVGPGELELVWASGNRAFPPRPHHQPIFSAVTSETHARRIAREWTLSDARPGYVLRFEVDTAYLEQEPVGRTGSAGEEECFIPAEELATLNAHIVGEIQLVGRLQPPPRTIPR